MTDTPTKPPYVVTADDAPGWFTVAHTLAARMALLAVSKQ